MCIHTSSATAEIMRVGDRHAAFIQGHWCWYQSKANMRFPIRPSK